MLVGRTMKKNEMNKENDMSRKSILRNIREYNKASRFAQRIQDLPKA